MPARPCSTAWMPQTGMIHMGKTSTDCIHTHFCEDTSSQLGLYVCFPSKKPWITVDLKTFLDEEHYYFYSHQMLALGHPLPAWVL